MRKRKLQRTLSLQRTQSFDKSATMSPKQRITDMFNPAHLIATLGLAFLVVGPSHAEVDSRVAEGLMRKSGLWQQLGGVAPQVRTGFLASTSQRRPTLSATEIERVGKVLDDAYLPERLRATSLAVLSKQLDQRRIPELNRWFAESLGQKIASLEEQASSDAGDPGVQMSKGNELLRSMSESRRAAIQDLVKASRAVDAMAEMTIETALAAAEGVASVTPDAPRMSAAELRQALQAQRPQMIAALNVVAAAGYAKMYAPLSIDEIRTYIRFMKSDAGSHFNESGLKAIGAAFKEGAAELGRRLPATKDQSNT